MKGILHCLTQEERNRILQELPSLIRETLEEFDYALLRKIIDTFFNCHFENCHLPDEDSQPSLEFHGIFGVPHQRRIGFPRERIILC